MLKHRHRYKIIGTGIIPGDIFIETDLICPKCGKTGTIYVNNMCETELMKIASKGKYFNIHRDFILTSKEHEKWLDEIKEMHEDDHDEIFV